MSHAFACRSGGRSFIQLGSIEFLRHASQMRTPPRISSNEVPSVRFMNVADKALRTWKPGVAVAHVLKNLVYAPSALANPPGSFSIGVITEFIAAFIAWVVARSRPIILSVVNGSQPSRSVCLMTGVSSPLCNFLRNAPICTSSASCLTAAATPLP